MVQEFLLPKYQCEKCLSLKNHEFTDETKSLTDKCKTIRSWIICESCGHKKMIKEMTVFNPFSGYKVINIEPISNIIKF